MLYLQKKTFKDFKDDSPGLILVDKTKSFEALNFGISPLHAGIRSMEFFTKLALNYNCSTVSEKKNFKLSYQPEF